MSSSAGWALWGACGPQPSEGTHTAAADEHDEEGLQHTGRAHHPGQPQEQDNPEDILQAGQVHPHEGAHAGCLWSRRGGGSIEHQRGPDTPWKASRWSLRRLLIPRVFYQRISWNPQRSPREHGGWGDS